MVSLPVGSDAGCACVDRSGVSCLLRLLPLPPPTQLPRFCSLAPSEILRTSKVVMRRLLASRDAKRRQRRNGAEDDPQGYEDEEDEELNPMTYRDSWTQTRPDEGAAGERDDARGLPPPRAREEFGVASGGANGGASSGLDAFYGEGGGLDDEPFFEGVGSAGFSEVGGSAVGGPRGRQQWERVSGRPRPRRRPPLAAAASSRGLEGERRGGRRARGDSSFGRERGRGDYGGTALYGGEMPEDSRMATGRKRRP